MGSKLQTTLGFLLLGCAVSAGPEEEETAGLNHDEPSSGGAVDMSDDGANGGAADPAGGATAIGGGTSVGGSPATGGTAEGSGGETTDTLLTSCPGETVYLGEVPECVPGWCDFIVESADYTAWSCYVQDLDTGACEAPDDSWGCCCHPVVYEGTGGSMGAGGSE